MANNWITERFPQFEKALCALVEDHRRIEDEPLHLAIAFGPDREPRDLFLFEVIDSFGDDVFNPEEELFETVFLPNSGFPMEPDQRLHLILTNPKEFEQARRDDWPSAREIANAIQEGRFQTLAADDIGLSILRAIQSKTPPVARSGS